MTFFVPHLFYRGQTENETRTNLVEQSKNKRDRLVKCGNYVATVCYICYTIAGP